MTVPLDALIETFPVWIESDFSPHPYGPPSSYSGSRQCDRDPFQPTFGSLVNEVRGYRADGTPYHHDAVDIGAAYGAAVVATCPGTVFINWHYPRASRGEPRDRPGAGVLSSVGGYVRVHGPGGYVLYYAHLCPVYARPGQTVTAGNLLGRVYHAGSRGGPAHLHYQIRRPYPPNPANGGRRVDTYQRLRELREAGQWRAPHAPLLASPFY